MVAVAAAEIAAVMTTSIPEENSLQRKKKSANLKATKNGLIMKAKALKKPLTN